MKYIALLSVHLLVLSQGKLERITLPGNKASLLAPVELTKMTDEMWTLKYQKRVRPILVLTDKTGEVNLIADLTRQTVTEDQLVPFKNFQIAQLKKNNPNIKVFQEGVKTINGKKAGYIKYVSRVGDHNVFNYYFFTIVDGKILFFTFNCIEKLRTTWEKTADQIVASLKTN